MRFERPVLDHVARLARLPLSDAEAARLESELAAILTSFEGLPDGQAVADPADAVAESAGRDDVVQPSSAAERDAIVAAFPRRDGDHAKVPRGL